MSIARTNSPSQTTSSPQTISSHTMTSHIPYLRRFARVLTGTQPGGDAYVVATLEAIVADPAGYAAAGVGRTALYRFFLKIWGSMPINDHVDQAELSSDAAAARRNLEAITLRPRIAFLLSALEEFEISEVAAALECAVEEAKALIDAAGEEIADQIRTDVLIIEDEPWIAAALKTLVEELGHRVRQGRAHPSRSRQSRQPSTAGSCSHRYTARGRQFGSRRSKSRSSANSRCRSLSLPTTQNGSSLARRPSRLS